MSNSIFEIAKKYMSRDKALGLHEDCSLYGYVNMGVRRLFEVIDEKDAVIEQRNGEIKNLHSDASGLRDTLNQRNGEIKTLRERVTELSGQAMNRQTEIAALRQEVQSLTKDLTSRVNDDKLQSDIQFNLAGGAFFIHDAFITSRVHDENQLSPLPSDFFVRNDAGDITGINAKYVVLDTAPGGVQLSEQDVMGAEFRASLAKLVAEDVRKELIKARQPGGVLHDCRRRHLGQ